MATSAIAGAQLFPGRIRVNRVRIWSTGATQNGDNECWVDFTGSATGSAGNSVRISDSALGTDGVAHVNVRPSRSSAASFWQTSTNANIAFSLYANTGSVVEVDVSYTSNETATAAAVANALVGATTGAVYMRGLDGLAVAGTNFIPVGFTTI